jgi:hypothetical protein
MQHIDDIYRAIIEKAIAKGWSPSDLNEGKLNWSFQSCVFFTKTPVWDGEKVIEQLGCCNIEKIIFDHKFAKAMYGEDEYTMVLSSLSILPAPERAEYMKLAYLNDEDMNKSEEIAVKTEA